MDTTYKIIALTIYFGAMLAIGLFAFRRTNDGDDYMLGGRRLGPFTAAMSAGASDMSGWLLMGLPGALYMSGLVESWIAIGLLIGAAVNWLFIAQRFDGAKELLGDVRLVATDADFSAGDGPVVEGSALDLLMVATGRAPRTEGLSGAGVARLVELGHATA